jgi:hypothetical protein
MENTIEPSMGLIIWQLILVVIIISLLVIIIKFYKKTSKYLDLKTEYLKEKIKSEQ